MMRNFIASLLLIPLIVSCKKETENIIWQRSFGSGNALFVKATSDSGFIGCGKLNSKPYLIKLSREKSTLFDFTSKRDGLFSSGWSDNSCFIAAGSSNDEMLLTRISNNGYQVWDTTISASFKISVTSLCYTGGGEFLAVGSSISDTDDPQDVGLLFIWFDTTGQIIKNDKIIETDTISASQVVVDNSGNIYLALTRKVKGYKASASVAKYNSNLQKLWEQKIYTNTDFTSVCNDVLLIGSDSLYATGKIEAANTSGTLENSFMVSLSTSGKLGWKKYFEYSNSGSALISNDSDILFMLNRNCFIISVLDPYSGTVMGPIRMFNVCDSYTTDAFGTDIDIFYDRNILLAGSTGGNFYLAIKPYL
jgi:hypothetical protein